MRPRLRKNRDLYLERMFETRSEAWERAGLSVDVSRGQARRARAAVLVLLPVLIAVLIVYAHRQSIFGLPVCHGHVKCSKSTGDSVIQWATVAVLLVLGWTLVANVGAAARATRVPATEAVAAV